MREHLPDRKDNGINSTGRRRSRELHNPEYPWCMDTPTFSVKGWTQVGPAAAVVVYINTVLPPPTGVRALGHLTFMPLRPSLQSL
jgi:hypothetical protein